MPLLTILTARPELLDGPEDRWTADAGDAPPPDDARPAPAVGARDRAPRVAAAARRRRGRLGGGRRQLRRQPALRRGDGALPGRPRHRRRRRGRDDTRSASALAAGADRGAAGDARRRRARRPRRTPPSSGRRSGVARCTPSARHGAADCRRGAHATRRARARTAADRLRRHGTGVRLLAHGGAGRDLRDAAASRARGQTQGRGRLAGAPGSAMVTGGADRPSPDHGVRGGATCGRGARRRAARAGRGGTHPGGAADAAGRHARSRAAPRRCGDAHAHRAPSPPLGHDRARGRAQPHRQARRGTCLHRAGRPRGRAGRATARSSSTATHASPAS